MEMTFWLSQTEAARWAYHQDYSGPIMTQLKHWLDQQCAERTVEPNSSLGKAIAYLQGHWLTLSRFLSVPGAPLDNNLVERALQGFVRDTCREVSQRWSSGKVRFLGQPIGTIFGM